MNLIRNRKGHTPHIVAVTAEPLPTRIASLALGIGDLDCVYHMALHELEIAVENNQDQPRPARDAPHSDQWQTTARHQRSAVRFGGVACYTLRSAPSKAFNRPLPICSSLRDTSPSL